MCNLCNKLTEQRECITSLNHNKRFSNNVIDNNNNNNDDLNHKNNSYADDITAANKNNSNNNIIIIKHRDLPREMGWCPAGDSLISWGEGSSLALVGNPSRDGITIKTLVWRHFKPTPEFMSELCLLSR